jgi:DNA-directed RNA polymerase subunit beta'
VDGHLALKDILEIQGEEALQDYMLNEIQKVYRNQNVKLSDKHIEIILRQMMSKARIDDPGDTDFLVGDPIRRSVILKENERLQREREEQGLPFKPASFTMILQGIAKASLASDSVIAAASFQETTKVLVDAAIKRRKDPLRGLKENVLIGRIIPAGTGFPAFRNASVRTERPSMPEDPVQIPAGEYAELLSDEKKI